MNTSSGYFFQMSPNSREEEMNTHNLKMNQKQNKKVTWDYSNYSYSRKKKSNEDKM